MLSDVEGHIPFISSCYLPFKCLHWKGLPGFRAGRTNIFLSSPERACEGLVVGCRQRGGEGLESSQGQALMEQVRGDGWGHAPSEKRLRTFPPCACPLAILSARSARLFDPHKLLPHFHRFLPKLSPLIERGLPCPPHRK